MATVTIPATVELPGEEVIEIAAQISNLAQREAILNGRQDTPLTIEISSLASRLFYAAFGESDDFDEPGLSAVWDEREHELTVEWARRLAFDVMDVEGRLASEEGDDA